MNKDYSSSYSFYHVENSLFQVFHLFLNLSNSKFVIAINSCSWYVSCILFYDWIIFGLVLFLEHPIYAVAARIIVFIEVARLSEF